MASSPSVYSTGHCLLGIGMRVAALLTCVRHVCGHALLDSKTILQRAAEDRPAVGCLVGVWTRHRVRTSQCVTVFDGTVYSDTRLRPR